MMRTVLHLTEKNKELVHFVTFSRHNPDPDMSHHSDRMESTQHCFVFTVSPPSPFIILCILLSSKKVRTKY